MENYGILSLIPALVTIVVALTTRRVALALFTGILAGALVAVDFVVANWPATVWKYLLISFTDPERLMIVLFIVLIGGLLELIAMSGAYLKFSQVLAGWLNTPRRSRLATWGLSMCLFFDDYANVLISGASMRQINTRNGVSPAMLAYIVDVVAIMASIMIVSTWASFEGSVMVDAGLQIGMEQSMTWFFLKSLPYHFYTYLAIMLAFVVAFTGKWFGYKADKQIAAPAAADEGFTGNARLVHVLAPVLTLIGFAILAMFVVGSYNLKQAGLPLTLINILGNAPSVEILIAATMLAILVMLALIWKDRLMRLRKVTKGLATGAYSMVDVSLVILFATGLAAVSEYLGTGIYISDTFSDAITPEILPALVFIIAMLITIATGFSWSSMAIVMPVAYQLAVANQSPELIHVMSAAVISGAVAGEHVIPFSEKCVMSSAACKIKPVYHIKTMILQTLAVFATATLGYFLLGKGYGLLWAYLASAGVLLLLHFLFARKGRPKQ